jgi:hypothetical protein
MQNAEDPHLAQDPVARLPGHGFRVHLAIFPPEVAVEGRAVRAGSW